MRRGRIEEASACAKRVAKANNIHLRDIDPRTGMAELWRRVANIKGARHKDHGQAVDLNITADNLNAYYASISTYPSYCMLLQRSTFGLPRGVVPTPTKVFSISHFLHLE